MSELKRNSFSGQQKAKVALEAVRGLKTINEIAQEYTVHPTQVRQWKKELIEQAAVFFDGKRGPKPVDAQSNPDRLYAKIGHLNMALEWLKKSPGSAGRRAPGMGCGGWRCWIVQAMYASWRRPCHVLRQETAFAGKD